MSFPNNDISEHGVKYRSINFSVKNEKILQFQETLKHYGGYFINNPIMIDGEWRVSFAFYNNKASEFLKFWKTLNTEIVEKKKKKTILEKIKSLFR